MAQPDVSEAAPLGSVEIAFDVTDRLVPTGATTAQARLGGHDCLHSALATILSQSDLLRAARLAAESGDAIDVVVTRLGLCSEAQLVRTVAISAQARVAEAARFPEVPVLAEQINPAFLRQARLLPLVDNGATIVVAAANPFDEAAVKALEYAARRSVIVVVAAVLSNRASRYVDREGAGAAWPAGGGG